MPQRSTNVFVEKIEYKRAKKSRETVCFHLKNSPQQCGKTFSLHSLNWKISSQNFLCLSQINLSGFHLVPPLPITIRTEVFAKVILSIFSQSSSSKCCFCCLVVVKSSIQSPNARNLTKVQPVVNLIEQCLNKHRYFRSLANRHPKIRRYLPTPRSTTTSTKIRRQRNTNFISTIWSGLVWPGKYCSLAVAAVSSNIERRSNSFLL